ncbi:MAG: hypothetical protein V7K47_25265 [Nostoc sp.]
METGEWGHSPDFSQGVGGVGSVGREGGKIYSLSCPSSHTSPSPQSPVPTSHSQLKIATQHCFGELNY